MKTRSSLTKNRGDMGVTPDHVSDVTPESTLELARAVSKCQKVDTLFAKAMLVQIVDPGLSDKAFRVLCLVRACSFDGPFALSYREIGMAARCSERQAIRICNDLQESGRISVDYRRTRRNVFSVPENCGQADHSCSRCLRSLPLDKLGICVMCRKQDRADLEVSKFETEKGESPLQIVWLGLKSTGSKCSQRDIEMAWRKRRSAIMNVEATA